MSQPDVVQQQNVTMGFKNLLHKVLWSKYCRLFFLSLTFSPETDTFKSIGYMICQSSCRLSLPLSSACAALRAFRLSKRQQQQSSRRKVSDATQGSQCTVIPMWVTWLSVIAGLLHLGVNPTLNKPCVFLHSGGQVWGGGLDFPIVYFRNVTYSNWIFFQDVQLDLLISCHTPHLSFVWSSQKNITLMFWWMLTYFTSIIDRASHCKIQTLFSSTSALHTHLIKITMINRSEIALETVQSHGRPSVSHV